MGKKVERRKSPGLREPVHQLLSQIIPVVRKGGEVPLLAVAEVLAGERIRPQIRTTLEARKALTFNPAKDGARFENIGSQANVRLKSFSLKVPERLSGQAELLRDGVLLRFARRRAPVACKLFFCIEVQRLEITRRYIYVGLEGGSFDQYFELQ